MLNAHLNEIQGGKVIKIPARLMEAYMYYDRTWTNMGSTHWKHMTTTSPNKTSFNTAQSSAKKFEKDNKRKATDEKSLRRECKYSKLQDTPAVCRAYNRHDGGITPDDCGEDISKQTLELLMSVFMSPRW